MEVVELTVDLTVGAIAANPERAQPLIEAPVGEVAGAQRDLDRARLHVAIAAQQVTHLGPGHVVVVVEDPAVHVEGDLALVIAGHLQPDLGGAVVAKERQHQVAVGVEGDAVDRQQLVGIVGVLPGVPGQRIVVVHLGDVGRVLTDPRLGDGSGDAVLIELDRIAPPVAEVRLLAGGQHQVALLAIVLEDAVAGDRDAEPLLHVLECVGVGVLAHPRHLGHLGRAGFVLAFGVERHRSQQQRCGASHE